MSARDLKRIIAAMFGVIIALFIFWVLGIGLEDMIAFIERLADGR